MSYIALYRKWRPQVFDDVVEQEHVVKTLKNAVKSGRVAHAYLFCGTRGTGKTTLAKILARAINCLNPQDGNPCNSCEICKGILTNSILDVIEIDAASNNSVDDIRQIKDVVNYAPSHAKYKVYIIDEVHMLSTGAFNALLKTLEEPPAHVVFILATTDPHKLPATILSRCQRYDFHRISLESISGRIEQIAAESGITLENEASRLIARMGDGALRDAISILDQVISSGAGNITYDDVLNAVGVVDDALLSSVVEAVKDRNVSEILTLVDGMIMQGKDAAQFVSDLVQYFRNILVCRVTSRPEDIIDASSDSLEKMKFLCGAFGRDELIYIIKELSLLESGMRWSNQHRILLEITLIRICEYSTSLGNDSVMDKLAALEKRIENIGMMPSSAPIANKQEIITQIIMPEVKLEEKAKEKPAKKAPEAKQAQAPGAGDKAKSVEEWPQIVAALKGSGRMALFTYLVDAKAVWLGKSVIGIVFGSSGINKTVVSKAENIEVVEATAAKTFGREVHIKCITEADAAESAARLEAPNETDDFLKKVHELTERLDAPVNIIDE